MVDTVKKNKSATVKEPLGERERERGKQHKKATTVIADCFAVDNPNDQEFFYNYLPTKQ